MSFLVCTIRCYCRGKDSWTFITSKKCVFSHLTNCLAVNSCDSLITINYGRIEMN